MVVFVAGVHGVGKTFLCQRFSTHTGIKHSSASSLIRDELRSSNWQSDKLVSDIDSNQIALTTAVRRIAEKSDLFLLDGHFVLKNSDSSLAAVHVDTFKELKLSAILLVESSPETIRERLQSRDSNAAAGDQKRFLAAERHQATLVSALLEIPLVVMHNPSERDFQDTLNKLFRIN